MKNTLFVVIAIGIVVAGFMFYRNFLSKEDVKVADEGIRYVALGDSYTIGLGVAEKERYPNILIDRLNTEGIKSQLIANLAVSGYTAQDVLTYEIPELQSLNPNFVTLLIGANDAFQNLDYNTFRKTYIQVLEKILVYIPSEKNLVAITIPNFAVSPAGLQYDNEKNGTDKIKGYNDIIQEEAKKRDIEVVNLFDSTSDTRDSSYFISDGLHPSGRQYEEWVNTILPGVKKLVQEIK